MSTPELRLAATVMLVREAETGFEVLLLRRNKDLAFAGGAYVFPGGSVDSADGDPRVLEHCTGLKPAEADILLGLSGSLRFYVAALREAFEEAGVFLGSQQTQAGDGLDGELVRLRHDLIQGDRSLLEVLEVANLTLDVGSLSYVAHWITPEGAPRRFDTRFFLAVVPAQQLTSPDESEIVGQVWISPAAALDAYRQGQFELVLPTVKNLEFLAAYETIADLLAGVATLGPIPAIQPRFYRRGDGSVAVALPGSPEYAQASPTALSPGEALPTRPPSHDA